MQIRVNGELREVEGGLDLHALLQELGVLNKPIAVEFNRSVVAKEAWGSVSLKEGDAVEIVQFVGGGS